MYEIQFLLTFQIQCNYIFVLDIGTIVTDQVCNPKLLIFDLEDDTLVKTIYIPLDYFNNRTDELLALPFVYFPKECIGFLNKMIVSLLLIIRFILIVIVQNPSYCIYILQFK